MALEQLTEQATLARPAVLEGIGLHSGKQVRLELEPARPGTGYRFVRADLPGEPEILACPGAVCRTTFCTTLGQEAGVEVATTEHVLAALRGLGVSNAILRLTGAELPLGDGSAAVFAQLVAEAGVERQGVALPVLSLERPVAVRAGEAALVAVPAREPRLSYVFTHPHPAVGVQLAEFLPGEDSFLDDLAPARTIGFMADIERMRAQGLALGGSLECAVVIGEDGYVGEVRFPNEPARHKLLDLMGDLALIPPVNAHVIGLRSGHALNSALAAAILEAAELTVA